MKIFDQLLAALEDIDYENGVTKSDWAEHWGKPCEWYTKGCIACDMWRLWTDVTGEVIEYEGHEEDCECSTCTADLSALPSIDL